PYPVLVLSGEQGSAKSTLQRILRRCIDPHRVLLRSEPREARDLMISANNGWTVSLDNVSRLPDWLSDALCRLATGGGFRTRTLYEDRSEEIFEHKRPLMVTGITQMVARGDLLDRAIVLNLPFIPDNHRRDDKEFWNRFDAVRSLVLGGLLGA